MSVRDSLDRIEYGKPASFHEINRLESLDEVLSALLLNYLKEELSKWETYEAWLDHQQKFLRI